MRRKVSTVLEESLFRKVKLESARHGTQISEVVAEALNQYLARGRNTPETGAVEASWGTLKMSRKRVKKMLDEEGDIFEA